VTKTTNQAFYAAIITELKRVHKKLHYVLPFDPNDPNGCSAIWLSIYASVKVSSACATQSVMVAEASQVVLDQPKDSPWQFANSRRIGCILHV
jgi:hypothetical protein